MIKIMLSSEIFNNDNTEEISFDITEEELKIIVKIAERNNLDVAIINKFKK